MLFFNVWKKNTIFLESINASEIFSGNIAYTYIVAVLKTGTKCQKIWIESILILLNLAFIFCEYSDHHLCLRLHFRLTRWKVRKVVSGKM